MLKSLILAAAPALGITGSALAQIVAIGPFTGPYTESFETQPALRDTFYTCLPGRTFNGHADICEPTTGTLIVPTVWTLFCLASPHSGTRYVVGVDGPLEITFDEPATKFGGYFATIGGSGGADFTFYDAAGAPIGTVPLATNNCAYVWGGWQSSTPFRRIRLFGNSPFSEGGYLHMDDLEYQGNPPVCYPNCDNSTTPPVLNVQDFSCFLNRFAAGDTYANCDNSTTPPALNVLDFGCFLNRFSTGCP